MRIASILGLCLCLACAADVETPSFDPEVSPGIESELAESKADGAFGSREISLGDTVSSSTGGEGLVLYSLQLEAGDQIRLEVTRDSGDLRPSAYLYAGINTYVRPTSYDVSSGSVELFYTIENDGEHFIAVKAHRGTGNGEFTLATSCSGGICDGASRFVGVQRADQCLTRAADCALVDLDSYNGRVGAATAQRILNECLAAEGDDCVDSCDAAPELQYTCGVILDLLPVFADTSRECLVEATICLDTCSEVNPYGYTDDTEYLQTPTCWDGHQGGSE
ncbi:MAG: hypothetical protein ACI9KE_001835 [Polyangiales bacterium]|jgi:hypothetical protein